MKMFVVFVILLHVSQHALTMLLEVNKGVESVLLPCQYSGIIPEINPIVMWTRYDLNPKSVHLQREGGDDLGEQNQHYRGRTSMRPDALDTGDFSLTLRNPELTDSGNYTCSLADIREELRWMDIQLEVKEPFPSWATALLVLLVLLVVSGGLLFHFRHYFMSVYKVEVEEGVKSVQLPCKTTVHIPEDAKVEWRNSYGTVHVYQNGSNQTQEQHQIFQSRTNMKRNLLKTGDLSLTMKYPTDGDNYTYTCTVYSREGNILMQKKVLLHVRDCQVEVEEGAESVQLPFKTTQNLPEDGRVEWGREEPEPSVLVHVYENGSDQPDKQHQVYRDRTKMNKDLLKTGDLSLTLKHPTERDSGEYTCRVYSEIKRYKRVLLRVRGVSDPPPAVRPAGLYL
ncbi:hypothetical protein ACER0C_002756 [Sarotherodon galilaeus]